MDPVLRLNELADRCVTLAGEYLHAALFAATETEAAALNGASSAYTVIAFRLRDEASALRLERDKPLRLVGGGQR